jgi:hypothetical protein
MNHLCLLWIISVYVHSFHTCSIFGGNGRPYVSLSIFTLKTIYVICLYVILKQLTKESNYTIYYFLNKYFDQCSMMVSRWSIYTCSTIENKFFYLCCHKIFSEFLNICANGGRCIDPLHMTSQRRWRCIWRTNCQSMHNITLVNKANFLKVYYNFVLKWLILALCVVVVPEQILLGSIWRTL